MDYKNEICNGCNQPINDGEDTVVCPVCGTPQHRSCWQQNSDCVNSSRHDEGFVWEKSIPDEPEVKPEPVKQEEQPSVFTQLSQEAQNLESVFLRDQMLHKDEEFDGINVSDAGYYLQSGAHRYIKRFRRNKKITWNWGAFFFAPAWFFYRKLYKFGAIFLAATVAISLFSYSFSESIYNQLQEVYTIMGEAVTAQGGNSLAASEQLLQNAQFVNTYKEVMKDFGVYILITGLIPSLFAALIGDFLVKKKMKQDIENAKSASSDIQMQRSLILSRGGVAPMIFAIVYFANQYLVSILMSIGAYITELF